MILITDGGSTKCDWSCHEIPSGRLIRSFQTSGLNPTYIDANEIRRLLNDNPIINSILGQVHEVFFFGSGCGNPVFRSRMKQLLKERFKKSSLVRVFGDIEGAVFASTDQPGVIAILGTGSNICYYDGNRVDTKIPSLGYSIMDQGSGSHMGRELLKAYYFGHLSNPLIDLMEAHFNLDVDFVKKKLYSSDGPSAYLASFADFIIKNDDKKDMSQIISRCLNEFFDLSVLQFQDELKTVPLHFVGSIAHFTSDYIQEICTKRGITLGNVVQRPIEGIFKSLETIRSYHH